MFYFQLFIGLLVYLGLAFISYSEYWKSSLFYYPLGLLLALIANFVWLWISKLETSPHKLIIKGLYWDAMLTFAYLAIPFLLFNIKLSNLQYVGLIFIVAGVLLTKL